MNKYIIILFFGLLLGSIIACHQSQNSNQEQRLGQKPNLRYIQSPPPLSEKDQRLCDSLKEFAYSLIHKDSCIIVYSDTISDIIRYRKFVTVLKKKFNLGYHGLNDPSGPISKPFVVCVQPLMDSFIVVKYGGSKAKDSMINQAYLLSK